MYILDVSCPCDLNIYKAEAKKVAKYIGLKGQLQKMWGFDYTVIPIIIGGLGGERLSRHDPWNPKQNHLPKRDVVATCWDQRKS